MSKIVEALRKLTSVDKPNKKLIKESIVHMKDENTFNDLVPASSLKVGDMVYDDETGHKLRVEEISNDVRSKYARKITFTDLDTMQSVVRYPGINWMYEKVFDNDTEFEVDDDIDMEFYPIDQFFEEAVGDDTSKKLFTEYKVYVGDRLYEISHTAKRKDEIVPILKDMYPNSEVWM